MTDSELQFRLQELIPNYNFTKEDIDLIMSSIDGNFSVIDRIETKSNMVYDAIGNKIASSIGDVRLYILKLILGGVDVLPSQLLSDSNLEDNKNNRLYYKFKVDRGSNGSIRLNSNYTNNINPSLFVDNTNIIYNTIKFMSINNTEFTELKLNVKPYRPDLNGRITSLLEQISQLKSEVESKDLTIQNNSQIIESLTDSISQLENNYNELSNQIISSPDNDIVSDIQNNISSIQESLALNDAIDSQQQTAIDSLPETIRSIVNSILRGNNEEINSGDDGFNSDDIEVGEGVM